MCLSKPSNTKDQALPECWLGLPLSKESTNEGIQNERLFRVQTYNGMPESAINGFGPIARRQWVN